MKKVILFYFLLTLFFFSRSIFGKVYLPGDILDQGFISTPRKWKLHNTMIGDVIVIFYPDDVLYNSSLKEGRIPLWNPYVFSGYPVFESGQSAYMHPLRLILHFLFDPLTAHDLDLFIHLFLSGMGMFLFLRELKVSNFSSAFGGVIWMFNFHNMVWFEYGRTVHVAAFLPFLLLTYERALKTKKAIFHFLSIIFFSLIFFSRNLQWSMYGYLLFFFYFVFKLICVRNNPALIKRAIFLFVTIALLGTGLVCIELIPTAELLFFYSKTQRGEGGIGAPVILSMREILTNISSFIYPRILGSSIDSVDLKPPALQFESQGYTGIIPLTLGVLSIFNRKVPVKKFFAILAIYTFSLCIFPILNAPLFLIIPKYSSLPAKLRIWFLTGFCMSALAAFGLDELMEFEEAEKKRFLKRQLIIYSVVLFIIVSIFILYRNNLPRGWVSLTNSAVTIPLLLMGVSLSISILYIKGLNRSLLKLYVMMWTIFDLLSLSMSFNTSAERELFNLEKSFIKDLVRKTGYYRIAGMDPNYSTIFRMFSPEGYNSFYPDWYHKAINPSENLKVRFLDLSPSMLKLLGVKYVIYHRPPPNYRRVENFPIPLYESDDALPRAFFIKNYKILPDKEIFSILKGDFSPSEILLLPDEGKRYPQPISNDGKCEQLEIKKYDLHEVRIEVNCLSDGFIVLSDTYYPGWKAEIDGRFSEIYRAYGFLRAVFVEKGKHTIVFKYRPSSLLIGGIISGFSVFLILIMRLLYFLNSGEKNENEEN
jgi:hypothetical protein